MEFEKTSKVVRPWRGMRVGKFSSWHSGSFKQWGSAKLGDLWPRRKQSRVHSRSGGRGASRLSGAAPGSQVHQHRMWGRGGRLAGKGAGAVGVGWAGVEVGWMGTEGVRGSPPARPGEGSGRRGGGGAVTAGPKDPL